MRVTRGRIVSVEVDADVAIDVPAGELAYVVLRDDGRVVDRWSVTGPATIRERMASRLPQEAPARPSFPADRVSVVVATRNRPAELAACLGALRAHAGAAREILVSDSASDDRGAIEEIATGAGAVLVRCERPGLSVARNAGALRATGEAIAFLDDDCQVEPGWLDGIRAGFTGPDVAAVTGSYLPAELDHEAQLLFLRYSHMDRRGLEPVTFSPGRRESRHWPLDAWRMGSGGNMAVRAEAFRRLGGFRTDLGLGTPARGGEDLFLLWSIVRSGGNVVYLPAAMVTHRHHRDLASLHRVMSGYGTGHTAYLRAARGAGAPWAATSIYALSVLYDRGKRAARAALAFDRATLALVAHETRGLLGWARP